MQDTSLYKQLKIIFPFGIEGIVFDCDGVLVDSKHLHVNYLNSVLEELGYEHMTEEQANNAHMASEGDLLELIVPREARDKVNEIMCHNSYYTKVHSQLRLEPGLREFLTWLKSNNKYVGINTNRFSESMEEIIVSLGLTELFHPIITADYYPAKPDPQGLLKILEIWNLESSKVVFIGDSLHDEYAAKAASVPLLSYRNKNLEASVHIENFSDLHSALHEYFLRINE